jgi:hypothetical protein
METKSAIIQEYRDECQSVLAPVRRLPSEILTQIFCLGTLEFEEDHYNKPTYHIEIARLAHAPLLLASQMTTFQLELDYYLWYDDDSSSILLHGVPRG